MLRTHHSYFILPFLLFLVSCDKGYELRFRNYYIEAMDSVIIGENKLVFTNVAINNSTEFKSISKGTYGVKCISKSKKVFESQIEIPKSGSGKRTVQTDGLGTIDVFEE